GITLDGLTIANAVNNNLSGGGITVAGQFCTISNCAIVNNRTGSSGGGVFAFVPVTLINCTITNNTAQIGGGVNLDGGGVLLNCTIVNNRANAGGGVAHGGPLELRNTIIANNGPPGTINPDIFTGGSPTNFILASNTLIKDPTGGVLAFDD